MVIRTSENTRLRAPVARCLLISVPTADKYKTKNFVDTVVYRGADAVSGWVFSGYMLRQHRRTEMKMATLDCLRVGQHGCGGDGEGVRSEWAVAAACPTPWRLRHERRSCNYGAVGWRGREEP